MERRKALAVAGTVAGSLAAAGAAMAVNFGLLGAEASTVGNLDVKGAAALVPSTTTTEAPAPDVTVIYQDVPVPSGGVATTGGGSGGGSAGGFEGSAPRRRRRRPPHRPPPGAAGLRRPPATTTGTTTATTTGTTATTTTATTTTRTMTERP
ncbi:MAG: hypothetical protein H6518_04960 [Microthrixaceae bacterium]|nr:hypothetical protein [Microthrixaceae bacterium]